MRLSKFIKFIKAAALVILGSLAIARVAAPVQAQQGQEDAAAFAEFKQTCSAEIATMKATLVSMGDGGSDAEIDTFLARMPAENREMAKMDETVANAAYYRALTAKLRTEAAKPDGDEGLKLLAPVMFCFYDVLIRRETGASAPAAAAAQPAEAPRADPPTRATTPAAGTSATDDSPVACVRLDDQPGAFRNDCDFDVYFTYCGVNPEEGSSVDECSKQSYGLLGIAKHGVQGGFTRAEQIFVFACRKPLIPNEVEYRAGEGLYGYCK